MSKQKVREAPEQYEVELSDDAEDSEEEEEDYDDDEEMQIEDGGDVHLGEEELSDDEDDSEMSGLDFDDEAVKPEKTVKKTVKAEKLPKPKKIPKKYRLAPGEEEFDEEANYDKLHPKHFEIPNKIKRHQIYLKMKREQNKAKKALKAKRWRQAYEAKQLGLEPPTKQIPKTIENMREKEETTVEEDDEEVKADEAIDEYADYFNKTREPKLIITTAERPNLRSMKLLKELKDLIPNADTVWRKRSSLKKVAKVAYQRGYTDMLVVNEDRRMPNGLLIIHLPEGPTANFRLSSLKLCKTLRKWRKWMVPHRPEVILNNFTTRLGQRVARVLQALFHYEPQFRGRRVVTFHNQRDYIFFRHHRYEFFNEKRVGLKEIGPQFTLKLRWLQNGVFNSKLGDYEWFHKRGEMDKKRKFHL